MVPEDKCAAPANNEKMMLDGLLARALIQVTLQFENSSTLIPIPSRRR
jgi:hypothetical protein